MTTTIKAHVPHVVCVCLICNRSYAVIEGAEHTTMCPYCVEDRVNNYHNELVSEISKLSDEITNLKRSNAALRGVITKLKRVDVKKFEVVEVDLSDLNNYILLVTDDGKTGCNKCDYSVDSLCFNKGFLCQERYGANRYFKLKPEIKAALESGRAVAKGGK